eukprot:TRINITY_DN25101_c0_g1_i1.p1 TRINITY_DN25101_c0_g1~~TRINITY_DN25101_c0_g1_i1.p1  ORF type:complete len:269 (+),score=39.04 TRINITY_DN25101_c0_g1_i1:42-809(+)
MFVTRYHFHRIARQRRCCCSLLKETELLIAEGGTASKELAELLRARRTGGIAEGFKEIDSDGDGKITTEEYKVHSEKLFKRMDKNADGVVDEEEFRRGTWLTGLKALTPPPAQVESQEPVPMATAEQLVNLSIKIAVPMVGFGFVDNFLMICCGELIEESVGRIFVLSTMAAAGLGNMCSDIAGLSLSRTIEDYSAKMGIRPHKLTRPQFKQIRVRIVTLLSSTLGIAVGCLIGMFPLLFIHDDPPRSSPSSLDD